ncbi:MAG: penicillin-binding protein [Oscillospiraceae bacterium]|nr:penicillin-binding protein [Oscillospiraceae bacterium]
MKKITNRAVSVLLIAALVIVGVLAYVVRYVDEGEDWALYFSRLNTDATGQVVDRNGVVLAAFSPTENRFAEDRATRVANYHVTGDYWGRSGTGVLSAFWYNMRSFNHIYGTTRSSTGTLQLSIDARLNNAAYNNLIGQKGAILICNYKTGEMLCMVSAPSVDPADAETEPEDGAFINRGLSSTFVPGSIFKLIIAAAAIENIDGISHRTFYCEGVTDFAGVEVTCPFEHYSQTFEQALANSCNVAFSRMAVQMGQDTMVKYVRDFGFLDGHELNGIKTAAGSYPTEFVGDPELGWSGIGQSTDLICPFSMLRYVSAIANGGVLVEPTLLLNDPDVKSVRLMQASTAETLAQMMSFNVAYSYGGSESFPGLALCAKTGTAEIGDGTSHAWFTGFLNDEAHPYAFVFLVERGGGGLTVAGRIAYTVLHSAVRS